MEREDIGLWNERIWSKRIWNYRKRGCGAREYGMRGYGPMEQRILNKSIWKYSSVFRENRCPSPPKPVCGGNFSHEAATLKIRSRSANVINY